MKDSKITTCVSIGRGGQSALRFARLRMEKRHNYVRKVAEVATQMFISNDKVNIAGLILAGSADFKTELSQSDMFDPVSAYTHFNNISILVSLTGSSNDMQSKNELHYSSGFNWSKHLFL